MISDLGQGISSALKGFFNRKDGEEVALKAAIKQITNALLAANVSPRVVSGLRDRISKKVDPQSIPKGANKEKILQKVVFDELCRIMDPGKEAYHPQKKKVSVVLFVGLQGSGKTTSCCKYALYHKKRGFRVGIVCADTFRAGAFAQVKQNCEKIDVPFFGSETETDPAVIARVGVETLRGEGHNLILVDTSGRHTQEGELFKEMEDIVSAISPDGVIFVVDASIGQAAEVHARGFKERVSVGAVIITKTDGTTNVGGAISSVAETGSPVAFIGTGEGMTDLEVFNAHGFVSKMLGMGDIAGLMDKLEGIGITEEKQEELLGKLKAGEFSMGDFYSQYKKILELGPLTQLLSMIPGMSNMPLLDEGAFRKMGAVFGAMTKKELNTNGEVFYKDPSRTIRVANGCGMSVNEIQSTIQSYRMMAQMIKRMASSPMFASLMNDTSGSQPRIDHMKDLLPPGFSSLFDRFSRH